ncbi:hypothetical protein BDV93DRAFT_524790 [Ceratobasidium sp. AG-I]|nr:hypothetical protein BDV93DRAFT_524790 [Ceratobasidium sp. AG-I]
MITTELANFPNPFSSRKRAPSAGWERPRGATVSSMSHISSRERRPSQTPDAFHAINRVAAAVAHSSDVSSSTPRRVSMPKPVPMPPTTGHKWLNLLPEVQAQPPESRDGNNTAPSYPTSHFPSYGQNNYELATPEPRAPQPQSRANPSTTPAVYDFSHLDRGKSFSSSTHTLTTEPKTPLCDSPVPISQRTNTLMSTASDAWPQDTLGTILGGLSDTRVNAMPQVWSGSPDGTIGGYSYPDQHPLRYDAHDSDTFRYT